MKLYTYFRSSASFRVRIALNLKGIAHDQAAVHLPTGAHKKPDYRALNPQGFTPALLVPEGDGGEGKGEGGEGGEGIILTQSMAILEYLDEVYPEPALLPARPIDRARVRAMANVIASDIHPVNNLRILKYLKGELGQDQAAVNTWYKRWIGEGFAALEALISDAPFMPGGRQAKPAPPLSRDAPLADLPIHDDVVGKSPRPGGPRQGRPPVGPCGPEACAATERSIEDAYNEKAQNDLGLFCFGNAVTLADICLIPQMWNARRFDADLSPYPKLVAIDAHLGATQAFRDAAPENQADFAA